MFVETLHNLSSELFQKCPIGPNLIPIAVVNSFWVEDCTHQQTK